MIFLIKVRLVYIKPKVNTAKTDSHHPISDHHQVKSIIATIQNKRPPIISDRPSLGCRDPQYPQTRAPLGILNLHCVHCDIIKLIISYN
jgi:hypothetical protein